MNNLQKGILLTLVSTLFNASTYIITNLLLKFTNVETTLVWWFFWGNIIFILFFIFSKNLKRIFEELFKNIKKLLILAVIGNIGIVLWTYGILYGNTTTLAFIFRLEAIVTIFLGVILLKERLSILELSGIIIAIIGAFVMVYQGGEMFQLGNLLILLAAIFSAISTYLVKVYVKGMSAYTLSFSRSVFAFLFIAIYAIALGKFQYTIQTNVIGLTFLAAFLGAFLGMFLLFKSLKFYELSKAIAVRSTEPLFVAILSLIVLATIPTISQLVGGILIVFGVIILSLAGEKKWKHKKY